MIQIDWSKAPKWANWWAMDANGVCFFYERQPFVDNEYNWWNPCFGDMECLINSETYNLSEIDWRNSLTRRPAAQTTLT